MDETNLPTQMVTNYVVAPAPALSTMETLGKFLLLLNERYPLNRTPNFNGNHSIVYDTSGLSVSVPCVLVTVWVFQQLDWRCYSVGLTDEDLRLDPQGLVNEVARVADPWINKLIAPSAPKPAQAPA